MADYLMKIGNFNRDYLDTIMGAEGYYDSYNIGSDVLKDASAAKVKNGRRSGIVSTTESVTVDQATVEKTYYWYEFSFIPNIGFLADPDPLIPDCEVELNFTRAKPQASVIQVDVADDLDSIELLHVHAITEYVSSPAMRAHFQSIDTNPIIYKYDNVEVLTKQIPQNDTVVRFDNMRGGSIPSYIFCGIIPSAALLGDYEKSSTCFMWNNIEELTITLNGSNVNGFPIDIRREGTVVPLQQFHDVTGRLLNTEAGAGMTLNKYETNFIWAHRFEAEKTANGWIGIHFKLKAVLSEICSLVVWIVSPHAVSIDKYHRIERVSE